MAETIETIEIAKAIKAGLDTALASAYPVYASGVKTNEEGTIDENVVENVRKLPNVVVTMRERNPLGYRSIMKEFPGRIRVATHFATDQFQVDLMTISSAVGTWLAKAPTLSLTLRKFDSLVVEQSPDVDVAEQIQFQQWEITVHTGPGA